jgi:hypothetical protein
MAEEHPATGQSDAQLEKTGSPPEIRLGAAVNGQRTVWKLQVAKNFLNSLPRHMRRVRLEVRDNQMIASFGQSGALFHGKYRTLDAQIGPANANMLPTPFKKRGYVETTGSFDLITMSYTFPLPQFVREDGVVMPDSEGSVIKQSASRAVAPLSTPNHKRKKPGWSDFEVKRLLRTVGECLKHRPDITILIGDDREVRATKDVKVDL